MTTNHLGNRLGGVVRIAWVHTLGREGEEKIFAGLEALGFEHRLHDFVGRAGIGRGLEDDELTASQHLCHGFNSLDDEREIGVLGLAQRCGHADVDDVHVTELRHVARRTQASGADAGRECIRRHVGDIALPSVDSGVLRFIDVESGDVEPGMREFNRERKTNVAETDDADPCLGGVNPLEELSSWSQQTIASARRQALRHSAAQRQHRPSSRSVA